MRCPKCHYISFGSVDRCRNCGYEFSLTPEVEPLDLPIQDDAPIGPMTDLQLRAPASRLDLPLFSDGASADDTPLITAAGAPRQPLSVRRAQPSIPKPRPEPTLPNIADEEDGKADRVDVDEGDSGKDAREAAADAPRASVPHRAEVELTAAPVFARLVAGLIDVTLLAGIDAAILYFTLQVLELPMNEVRSLPPVPLAVFLLLLNGGYLAIFTAAGGQTIGKMLARIRVVATPPDDDEGFDRFTRRVSLGAAVLRAAAYLASLLPAGLGFIAILFDAEGRALHDRLAETRVIKA
jgi:uncharacterized RDD family membrane protein YckC